MNILSRSIGPLIILILTGPAIARSEAFVEQNKLDQLHVTQQNTAAEARMNALTKQGKSIFHEEQQQVRAAQIQQGFQGLENAVDDLNKNMHAIDSLEAAREDSAFPPGYVAAHPEVLNDPLLSLFIAARQVELDPRFRGNDKD